MLLLRYAKRCRLKRDALKGVASKRSAERCCCYSDPPKGDVTAQIRRKVTLLLRSAERWYCHPDETSLPTGSPCPYSLALTPLNMALTPSSRASHPSSSALTPLSTVHYLWAIVAQHDPNLLSTRFSRRSAGCVASRYLSRHTLSPVKVPSVDPLDSLAHSPLQQVPCSYPLRLLHQHLSRLAPTLATPHI